MGGQRRRGQDAWRYIFAVTALPAILELNLRLFVQDRASTCCAAVAARQGRAINRVLLANGKPALGADEELVSPPHAASKTSFQARFAAAWR